MRHLLCLLFCTLLAGCGTPRKLPVVERIQRDTLYLHQVQYDSVYVYRDRYVDRSRDTVYVNDRSVAYRYRLQRDTLRIHRVDSIPVIREVEVVREVARTPWYAKLLAAIGLLGLFLFLFKIRKSCR
ncbi:hypothetical protein JQM84_11730 [Parabacteroides distasonis]|nr:hypothetical protein [Parabacteroides distasonis]